MKKIRIPMIYEVYTFVEIEAETTEDAIKIIYKKLEEDSGDLFLDCNENDKCAEVANLKINSEALINGWR